MPNKFQISLLVFGVLAVGLVLLLHSFLWIVAVDILAIIFYGLMAFCIRCNFYLNAIHKTKPNHVVLTFDDGPDPSYTPAILATLKKHDVKAIFFLIGKNADSNPALVREILADGHKVGSHSYAHPNNFGFMSKKAVQEEIQKGLEALGGMEIKLFRPPVGITNPNVAKAVHSLGLTVVGWSVRSLDTITKEPQKLLNRILNKVKGGDVILLHDTQFITAQVLDELITELKNRSYILTNQL